MLPGLIALAVVGSAMGVGGALPWVVMATTGLAVAVIAVAAVEDVEPRPHRLSPVIALWLLSAFSLAQAVAMPMGWLEALAPSSADIWSRALSPMGEQVHFGSVSLEPGASMLEAAKWATYAGIFHGASVMARREGSELGLCCVFGSALLVALVTIAHGLTGATRLFGVYEPRNPPGWEYIGPFLNPNNLAGYLALGALCGIGLIFSRRPLVPVAATCSGVVVLVAVTVRSASRGGVLALLVGLLTFALFLLVIGLRRREIAAPQLTRGAMGAAALAAALGIGLAVIGATDAVWRDLLSQSTDKLRMVQWCVPVVQDHPWLGVGRGAFESVFSAYRPPLSTNVIFTHPENVFAQWAAEWGLPVSIAAFAYLAWQFRPWRLGVLRSASQAAAFCGIIAITAQNLVDLSLELAGVGVAFAVVAGSLWGDARKLQMRGGLTSKGTRRFVVVAGAVWTGLTCVVAVFGPTRPVSTDRDLVHASLDLPGVDPAGPARVRTLLRDAMLRHPADYYFPLVGAKLAQAHGDQSPIPWVQRALERGPTVGRTHLLLADVLASRGASRQALMEIRFAATYDRSLTKPGAALAVRISQDSEQLMWAVPEGVTGAAMLSNLSARLPQGPGRDALDTEALERSPTLTAARERLTSRLLAALAAGSEECAERAVCETRLEAHAAAFDSLLPQSSKGAQLRAAVALVRGDRLVAREILQVGCRRPHDAGACLEQLAVLTEGPALEPVLDRYVAVSCATKPGCAQAWSWIATLRAGRQEWAQAAGAARRAATVQPTGARWVVAADYAERVGLRTEAASALEQALGAGGVDQAEVRRRLSALRSP